MRRSACLAMTQVALTLTLTVAFARADMIIFKDGFILHGKVSRDGETIADPVGGQAISIPKGPFFILDGARRISFSFLIVEEANKKDIFENVDFVKLQLPSTRLSALAMDPLNEIIGISDFNEKWERIFTYGGMRKTTHRKFPVEQRMGMLTPLYARVDARKYNWSSFHLTSEFSPETVLGLLRTHPELKDQGNKGDVERRLRIYRFLTQAGWYKQAEQEIDAFQKSFPDEKEKLTAARDHLKGLKALDLTDKLEVAYRTGRHRWAQDQLGKFPRDVDERILTRIRLLEDKYETANKAMEQVRKFTKELAGRLTVPFQQKLFGEAAESILADLSPDNVGRLEPFIKRAQQAELDRAQGRNPDISPAELFSLAINGWLLGKDSFDTKVETAQRLWRSRRFVLDYLKTADPVDRERLLSAYLKQKYDVIAVDELAQMLLHIPPAEAEENIERNPLKLRTGPTDGHRKGIGYLVQLPPEYSHARSYPVVVALHQAGENAEDMLARCGEHAAANGYILVAPAWQENLGPSSYSFTSEEHACVTHVLLDAMRRFKVDADRIFLVGYGDGGTMALDVGLSHPDLFAGVVPVSPSSKKFIRAYLHNAQYLPIYLVQGTHAGEIVKQNSQMFERWLPAGYTTLNVEYKGRGLEWFAGETTQFFEWMNRKKRAAPFPELGRREFFQTMRVSDNRFYWISSDSIRETCLNNPNDFRTNLTGATLQARIVDGNQINITAKGFRQLTIWLGRDASGRDMVDFTKPVTVRVNGTLVPNKPVKPDVSTLLEDFHDRSDRQRLFLAKIPIDLR